MSDEFTEKPQEDQSVISAQAPHIFDQWDKSRIEKSENLNEEIASESMDTSLPRIPVISEVVCDLTTKFYDMVSKVNPKIGRVNATYNLDEGESGFDDFFLMIEVDDIDSGKLVIVKPHDNLYSSNPPDQQRIFHTSHGEFPEIFVDGEDNLFTVFVEYRLSDSGVAEKVYTIKTDSKKESGTWMDQLPHLQIAFDTSSLTFIDNLNHQDLAQLRSYITLYGMGKLQF